MDRNGRGLRGVQGRKRMRGNEKLKRKEIGGEGKRRRNGRKVVEW